jgi:hypothetical protein
VPFFVALAIFVLICQFLPDPWAIEVQGFEQKEREKKWEKEYKIKINEKNRRW